MSRIHAALQDFDALDALAAQPTALSRLDPRAKILATLGFIFTVVSFDRYTVAALLPFAFFPLLMAAWGDISLRIIGRTVLLASPFAVMVGMFNPWLDQRPLLTLLGYPIDGGWVSFASILIRFGLTVAAGLVLVASTGLPQICAGLERLGVPQVFTTQLLFLHRYALVLAHEASRMSLAHELRANGKAMPLSVYGHLLGHLLLRALQRAERIHQAMLSRGFDGHLRHRQTLRWQRADMLFLLMCSLAFVLARQLDLAHLLGQLVLDWLQ
ncbi:MAG: cobalt ECF transporter T component CbiQ [Rhodoferax sp.]|nr:cobalt ECF transporter T component CbiQ [Rhodoferax sp.]